MAYQKSGGNKAPRANSKFVTFYNQQDGDNSSCLSIGAWDSAITLNIAPLLPEDRREGSATFDYQNQISVLLSPQQTKLFSIAIDKVYNEYLKAKKGEKAGEEFKKVNTYSIRVGTGQNAMQLEVGFSSPTLSAKSYEEIPNRFYVCIFALEKGDKKKSKAKASILFVFEPEDTIGFNNGLFVNYDEESGDCKKIIGQINDFLLFKGIMDELGQTGLTLTNHLGIDRFLGRFTKIEELDSIIKGMLEEMKYGKSRGDREEVGGSDNRYRSRSGGGTTRPSRSSRQSLDDEEEEETRPSRSSNRSSRHPVPDDEEEEEQDERPIRKAKKSAGGKKSKNDEIDDLLEDAEDE